MTRRMRALRPRDHEYHLAWLQTLNREPWKLNVEAYMAQASTPGALGRWISAIWKRTDGAKELRSWHAQAVQDVLRWQEALDRRSLRAVDLHLAAVRSVNLYAKQAGAWAGRPAA